MRANVSVICKFGMCHEIIPGSSNGGFSVVKHLNSLEIALYCYKELRRNVLDFWSRFQTEKPPKTAHFTIACTICDLHKKQTEFPRGRDDLREARSNFTASQIDQSEALSLFQPRTNNERAWPRVHQSSSLCPSCAKEKSSGIENGKMDEFCDMCLIFLHLWWLILASNYKRHDFNLVEKYKQQRHGVQRRRRTNI